MPNAVLLYLGDARAIVPESLTSPWPGDPWQVEPAADTAAALDRLARAAADAVLIESGVLRNPAVDAARLRAETDARGVSVILLGPAPPDGPLAGAAAVPVDAGGHWRHDLAQVIERVRIDRQLREFRELGGDEFVTEMIDLLLQQTPQQLEAMRTALAASALRDVQRVAHSLKSSAGNFGACAVQELALQIERSAAGGDSAPLAEKFRQLGDAYERVRVYSAQKRG